MLPVWEGDRTVGMREEEEEVLTTIKFLDSMMTFGPSLSLVLRSSPLEEAVVFL
jgi:hypothetical protein